MRACCLSGGGCKGAYQTGAIRYLLGRAGLQYDIYCGVSVGAINAAYLSMFPIGEEKKATLGLDLLWGGLSTPKVYKRWWPFGKLHGLWERNAYNNHPLHNFIRQHLDADKLASSGHKLRVGAVSLWGDYRVFREDEPCIVNAVLASSAVPALFEPIPIDGQLWVDGAVREDTPLATAIDLGADEIDVIVTSPETTRFEPLDDPNAFDVLIRAIDIMSDEIMDGDIRQALLYNRLVQAGGAPGKRDVKIRIIRPKEVLVNDLLDFNPDTIQELMVMGYHDAMVLHTSTTPASPWLLR